MKCLFITAHFPRKNFQAGHSSALSILEDYIKKGYKVDVICICNSDEVFGNDFFISNNKVNLIYLEKLNTFKKFLNILMNYQLKILMK